jgi:hypothetical protein
VPCFADDACQHGAPQCHVEDLNTAIFVAGCRRADRAERRRDENVTITSMSQETVQGAVMARGTALLALDKLYSPSHSREPRTEHWMLSLTYYLNPKQVSDQAKIYPQYEFINPLGLTITEVHVNRVSVDPIAPGAAAPNPSVVTVPNSGAAR